MRIRLIIVGCLMTLLPCATQALDNKFDIILEGPWILYQYHNDNLNKGVPVLIAVAPKVNGIYHAPILSTGDGYTVWQEGIFCLTFGQECATNTGAASLRPSAGYRTPNLVPVKFKNATASQTDWDLVSLSHSQSFFVFILPMPNGFSNESVWNMQFGRKFDKLGAGYKGDAPYSIGLQLHYDAGPATFDLFQCSDLTTANCKYAVPLSNGRSTTLTNTGTLEMIMKAPDDDDICDYHVRKLHHPTLYLLDATKLNSDQNTNQDFGYVDPARKVDVNGVGNYTDLPGASCYTNDAQSRDEAPLTPAAKPTNGKPKTAMMETAMPANWEQFVQQLDKILADFKLDVMFVKQIDDELKLLKGELGFPRISDLSRFAQLLHLAADKAEKEGKTSDAIKLRKFARAAQTKDGADCRFAIMLVTSAMAH